MKGRIVNLLLCAIFFVSGAASCSGGIERTYASNRVSVGAINMESIAINTESVGAINTESIGASNTESTYASNTESIGASNRVSVGTINAKSIASSIESIGVENEESICFALDGGAENAEGTEKAKDFIKWVDLNFTEAVLNKAYMLDVKYHGSDNKFDFVEALSYLAVKNGNKFSQRDLAELDKLAKKVESGGKIAEGLEDNKYFKYYKAAFGAVFSEFIGSFILPSGESGYGLTAYFPFAKGYGYSHYDDFGNSRSYGFKRKHLGHDMMGGIGTPIVAVEGGTVTELGWNRYGGWRVGVLSFDKTRYYYYAHLRKNKPFAEGLKQGAIVNAGEVIGYLGMTGYSNKENQNLTSGKPHLHIGLQLIFDQSQIKGNREIWVDLYAISGFLQRNKARVIKNADSGELVSVDLRKKLRGMPKIEDIFPL